MYVSNLADIPRLNLGNPRFSCDVIIFQKLNITFPSEVLVLSDKRPYRNLTFHNVLARQGSSYCNRARLNFQAFSLRDMKIATREGCHVGKKDELSL